ncbi:MAG: YMGG-like glycine zipper-containing protein [Acidobacteria bacterium]|nr:YMGG-like glycine zipper-containing protein [Acidobacteriota bacterium]
MTGMTRTVVFAVAATVGLGLAAAGLSAAPQRGDTGRMNDQQLRDLANRIDSEANTLRSSLGQSVNRSRIGDQRWNADVNQSVTDFLQATRRLRDLANRRQVGVPDVEDVLRRGTSIDSVMQRYEWSPQAEQQWLRLSGDLDVLARGFNVAWNWNPPGYTTGWPAIRITDRLTGTYQLDAVRSDDPRRAAELAVRTVPPGQQQRTYQSLLGRLEAPDQIAIERRNSSVTMASTRGPRVTIDANGSDRQEQWATNRTMTTRATLTGDRLVVATTGHRGSAYTATYEPTGNGGGLQMALTIDDESLARPVTVRSVYRRTSDQPRWDIEGGSSRAPYGTLPVRGGVVVENGTRFVAVLDNALSTVNAREGDRFTMTARSPSGFEGAVIQGFVSSFAESGRMTGRAGMTLNLESIRLRDGRAYDFDGMIEDVRTPDGQRVRVDREGAIGAQDSQTQKTIERGAIGAALGALIGAVIDGGKGAAIGAAVGAGGGAGTVMIEGRDRLDLPRGTEVTFISTGSGRLRTGSGSER